MDSIVLTPTTDDFKVPEWVCYMVIKEAFEYKTKGVYFKGQPK